MTLDIDGPAGKLEAILEEPAAPPRAAAVIAHPLPTHGGTMHTKVVFRAAKAFVRIGCSALRFNFRGVGRSEGTFDEGRGELDDYRASLDYMAARYPGTSLWAAGFSFGSYIALTCGAPDQRVAVLVGISPPLDRYDFSELARSTKPKFFIQGERDEICPLPTMWRFYGALPEPKELVVVDGADHLYDGKTHEVGDAIEELLGDYQGAVDSR